MIKKIIGSLIVLAISYLILILGVNAMENVFKEPTNRVWTLRDWLYFIAFYVVIIRPVVAYWYDKVEDVVKEVFKN